MRNGQHSHRCDYCKAEWVPVCNLCLSETCLTSELKCPAQVKKSRLAKTSQEAELSIPHDGTGAIDP